MEKHDLDAIVSTSFENVTYVTGYVSEATRRNRRTQFYGLLPRSGDPVLILPALELCVIVDEPLEAGRVASYGSFHLSTSPDGTLATEEKQWIELTSATRNSRSPVEALVAELKDLGLARGRIGLDETGIPPELRRALQERLSQLRIVDAAQIFREIRMVKTADEIEKLRGVAAINQRTLRQLIDMCEPGMTSARLAAHYREGVTAAGALPGLWTCLGGARSSGFFRPSGVGFLEGDLVRFDVGCALGNYWADMGRTVSIRRASEKLENVYAAILKGYEAAVSMLKPGVPANEVFRAAMETVRANGLRAYDRHHCGHGIGLEFYESPMIAADDATQLVPGMVINVELPYYELGFGGIQIEDTFVIGEDGPEPLTTLPMGVFITA